MPRGIYPHLPHQGYQKGHTTSEETRQKIRKSLTGRKFSEERKAKMKGMHNSPATEFKKGLIPWSKGRKLSPEHREKCIKTLQNKGGPEHPSWIDGRYYNDRAEYNRFSANRRRARKIKNGGSHTLEEWQFLKEAFDNSCISCGKTEPYIRLTEDHIVPLSLGGNDDIENIQPLCFKCNIVKHAKVMDFRESWCMGKGFKSENGNK
jgi:5-methylcytosine-specific restriction endonuclease McrA